MIAKLSIVAALLFGTATLSFHLCGLLWRRRSGSRSAGYMSLLMGATAWWSLFNALEYLAATLDLKLVFADLQYAAIAAIPALWYASGSSYQSEERSGSGKRPTRLIWILPALTALLVWLDPWLGLVRRSFVLADQGGLAILQKEFGPWFWIHSAYSYAFIAAGTILHIRGMVVRKGEGRAQLAILLAAVFFPILANALYLTGLLPTGGVDPTPLAFAITGLLFVLNLSRYRFLAGLAAARAELVEQLRDPIIVTDYAERIAYANAAARSTLGLGAFPQGLRVSELRPPLSSLAELRPGDESELRLPDEGAGVRRFEARAGRVGSKGNRLGLAIAFFDVTRRAAAEEGLKEANLLLEDRIRERTRELEDSNARMRMELEHRVRIERQLTHEAVHDPLTGLANRSLLLSRVEQAILRRRRDSASAFGLLYIDFDGFKAVNDAHGHEAGDRFLRETASRLKQGLREADTVARIGGDEFVVLLDEPGSGAGVAEAAERLAEDLAVPIQVGGGAVLPSASIGILYGDHEYGSAADVLQDADIAMYRAKALGKNRRVLFEAEMRRNEAERHLLKSSLRAAIASGGIGLAYQPIVRMTGGVAGWEVLARWRSAEFGDVGPDRFIPLAEESGLIVPLGTYVLIEALKQAASMRDAGLIRAEGEGAPFFSVNVSAIQLGEPDFAELVLEALANAGLPRSILHLELTESALVEGLDKPGDHIAALAAAGVSFKIDDFGMGYSSLSYLYRMPIDCIKIDRSFVERMSSGGGGLVRGIISLSHELGKTVVAEGVETREQAAALEAYGCDFGQGWLYGRPLDRSAFELSMAP